MLIERMQTNPEDFKTGGKLYRMTEQAQMSARDKKAYYEAHDLYIKEPNLMVRVLEALLAQPEEEAMRAGSLGITGRTVDKMWFDELTNTAHTDRGRISREMFEDHIQTHKKLIQDKATKVTDQNVLKRVYDQIAGRERIERDN